MRTQAVADAGSVAVVVAALQAHPSEVSVQQPGCAALFSIMHGGAAYAQAVVDAAGAVAVVAALQAHLSHVAVQQNGCGALSMAALCAHRRWWTLAAWRQWWAGGAASKSKSCVAVQQNLVELSCKNKQKVKREDS